MRIIIVVDGGNVQAVYSNTPDIQVEMCDWDNAACDEECKVMCEQLAAQTGDMFPIY